MIANVFTEHWESMALPVTHPEESFDAFLERIEQEFATPANVESESR